MRPTGIDIQIQGQFGAGFNAGVQSHASQEAGIDFVCGKNYNSNKPSENQILVKLQRVYERMTWLGEAMKDGVSTDMPRGAANWL